MTTTNSSRTRIMTIIGSVLTAVGIALTSVLLTVAPASAANLGSTPPPLTSSAPGSVKGPDYSVSVTQVGAAQSSAAPTFQVTSTGYSAGNWINLWYRPANSAFQPQGNQNDWGGAFSTGSPQQLNGATALPAGNYVVQASIGKYPDNAWSGYLDLTVNQNHTLTVAGPNTPVSISAPSYTLNGTSAGYAPGTTVMVILSGSGTGTLTTQTGPDGRWTVTVPRADYSAKVKVWGVVRANASITDGTYPSTASTSTRIGYPMT